MTNDVIFPFGLDKSVNGASQELLGNKGYNLLQLESLGMPVPPGFIVSTAVGEKVAAEPDALSDKLITTIAHSVTDLETVTGRTFGSGASPLLVSVRSGAALSMPGMMDTVLNLGLNDHTVEALAVETNDARFAWDSYRRFVQGFAAVVLDFDSEEFEIVLEDLRAEHDVETDSQLPVDAHKVAVAAFFEEVAEVTGKPFPQDAHDQLRQALIAVFQSWNTSRAVRYRQMNKYPDKGGTAATIQAMVFGNRDERSCTGVYFTRNPSTGQNVPYGEFMVNAQGEDVVSGVRTPMEITEATKLSSLSESPSMEMLFPDAFNQLHALGEKLETHFGDMQEIEFTVEQDELYLLQVRSAKRTAGAALKISVDMAETGLISKQTAVQLCEDIIETSRPVSRVIPGDGATVFAKGLAASPGTATGPIVFSSDDAVSALEKGIETILVRPETDPKDVHGMNAAAGILTSRGGMTSHAAVVARGMGKPCITAAMTMKIDTENKVCRSLSTTISLGDVLTIDGSSGLAYLGDQPTEMPEPDGNLATILAWREAIGS